MPAHDHIILSIFLLVVGVEIDRIMTKPYIPFNEFVQNSFSCILVVLYHWHDNF